MASPLDEAISLLTNKLAIQSAELDEAEGVIQGYVKATEIVQSLIIKQPAFKLWPATR